MRKIVKDQEKTIIYSGYSSLSFNFVNIVQICTNLCSLLASIHSFSSKTPNIVEFRARLKCIKDTEYFISKENGKLPLQNPQHCLKSGHRFDI